MTKQEMDTLTAAKKANPSAGRKTLSRLTGITSNKVQAWLAGRAVLTATPHGRAVLTATPHGRAVAAPVATAAAGTPAKMGRSLTEFRATYDKATIVPTRVKAALKALGAGGWEYENIFARAAGVSLSDLANFRDAFAAHIVSLREGRRAWAGSAATAAAMREMI
jgi:hypothetical protein